MDTITLNKKTLKELKQAYEKSKQEGKEEFVFMGKVFLTDYARYVIEYAELSLNEYDSAMKINRNINRK